MPRKESLDGYPNREFAALVGRVVEGEEISVPCTRTTAMSLRSQFYAWRRTCEALPEEAARLGVDWTKLRAVACTLSDEALRFVPAGTLPIPALLRKVLGEEGIAPAPSTDAEASLARLQEMLRKGGDGEE